tara:strand:- start:651 stop:1010 length:360 start_codon:yes stop_codon:yes gene_type:complete
MNFPNEMSGTHPLAGWCNKLLRAAKASRVSNGIGYKTRIGSDGTILEALPGNGGGGVVTSSYRGLYNPATSYALHDIVVGAPGAGDGTFIAVISNPSAAPQTGVGWVQIAQGSSIGYWS